MLFKQLFLLANDPITIWQQQKETFVLIDANEQAKKDGKKSAGKLDAWFPTNEVGPIHSLCMETLINQEQHEKKINQKQITVIPLSMDTVAVIEKKVETIFPFLTSPKEFMLTIDSNHLILDHSPSLERLTGFSSEDFLHKHALEFIHPDDRHHVQQTLKKIKVTKMPATIECHMWTLQDTYTLTETSFSPVFAEQGVLHSFLIIGRDITKQKEKNDNLYYLAFHDPLTELPNRRLFMEQFKQTILQYERKKQPFAILLLDCDHFKTINDTYGHDIGDEVIKGFAKRIKKLIRKSDILSRFGGDEFSLLLPEVRSQKDAERVAKRIVEKIRKPWVFNNTTTHITTSVGIFYADENTPNVTLHDALKKADIALYQAKKNGKNHFQLYEIY